MKHQCHLQLRVSIAANYSSRRPRRRSGRCIASQQRVV